MHQLIDTTVIAQLPPVSRQWLNSHATPAGEGAMAHVDRFVRSAAQAAKIASHIHDSNADLRPTISRLYLSTVGDAIEVNINVTDGQAVCEWAQAIDPEANAPTVRVMGVGPASNLHTTWTASVDRVQIRVWAAMSLWECSHEAE